MALLILNNIDSNLMQLTYKLCIDQDCSCQQAAAMLDVSLLSPSEHRHNESAKRHQQHTSMCAQHLHSKQQPPWVEEVLLYVQVREPELHCLLCNEGWWASPLAHPHPKNHHPQTTKGHRQAPLLQRGNISFEVRCEVLLGLVEDVAAWAIRRTPPMSNRRRPLKKPRTSRVCEWPTIKKGSCMHRISITGRGCLRALLESGLKMGFVNEYPKKDPKWVKKMGVWPIVTHFCTPKPTFQQLSNLCQAIDKKKTILNPLQVEMHSPQKRGLRQPWPSITVTIGTVFKDRNYLKRGFQEPKTEPKQNPSLKLHRDSKQIFPKRNCSNGKAGTTETIPCTTITSLSPGYPEARLPQHHYTITLNRNFPFVGALPTRQMPNQNLWISKAWADHNLHSKEGGSVLWDSLGLAWKRPNFSVQNLFCCYLLLLLSCHWIGKHYAINSENFFCVTIQGV